MSLPGTLFPGIFFAPYQPKQGIYYQPVLDRVSKAVRQDSLLPMIVVNIIMPHIEIDHAVADIGPYNGVVAAVPDFVRLGTGSQGETGTVDGQQQVNFFF